MQCPLRKALPQLGPGRGSSKRDIGEGATLGGGIWVGGWLSGRGGGRPGSGRGGGSDSGPSSLAGAADDKAGAARRHGGPGLAGRREGARPGESR